MRATRLPVLALVLATTCRPAPRGPAAVDTDRILAADREPGSWLTHGRTYDEQRFSPLAGISGGNVDRLGLAWSYELRTPRGASATPLVADGVMYLTSSWSLVYALDAATGRELWVYDPRVDRATGWKACCDVTNRGVALYQGKVYVGVIDGRLVALDARDGAVLWEKVTVDPSRPYTITGAPRAANGLVLIGNGGADLGVRGYVSAYDAATGDLAWRFYTVPGDPARGPDGAASDPIMARAAETWTGEWWKLGGGGTVWDAIVYDPDFDQVIVGVGNGSPWNRQVRSPGGGDNWFLSSILALDARTGAYKWHYQTTPGDTWDYTATQPIVLADLTIGGRARKVAMQAPKNGFFYVVDRADGRLISAQPFLPMFPTEDTPAGVPLSWAYAVDSTTGRPIENPEARYVGSPALVRPGPLGAHNWHPMSFSPLTGLVYLPAQELAFEYAHDPAFAPGQGVYNLGIAQTPLPDDPKIREFIRRAAKGILIAWDPVSRKEAWHADRPVAWNGGTLATAGGLVFQGTGDGRFQALDATTGERRWEFETGLATLAGPIAYELNGEQYVAALSGYGSVFFLYTGFLAAAPGNKANGRVYAFKLGGTATPPAIEAATIETPRPPTSTATVQQVKAGEALYALSCVGCHGVAAIGGGVIADLRKSAKLGDPAAWAEVVIDGSLRAQGMPALGDLLTPEAAELIRAYVIRQAGILYTAEQAANAGSAR
jgi:PQQ-dependent dehydrogenase (methanol/ethanol family)